MKQRGNSKNQTPLHKPHALAEGALVAAAYAALTVFLSPISYGPVQVRVAEALCLLAAFTPAAVPGLFVGCVVANLMSPYGLLDLIVGSLATLLGAYGICRLAQQDRTDKKRRLWLLPLPAVIANGLLVGALLHQLSGVDKSLLACMAWVAFGEALSCYGLGLPLWAVLNKNRHRFEAR